MIENNSSGTVKSRIIEKKYDDKEDKSIKKIALKKENIFYKYIFCLCIIIVGVCISLSVIFFDQKKNVYKTNSNLIEFRTKNKKVSIVNNGKIRENINDNKFTDDKYVLTKVNSLSVISNQDDNIKYNVRFNIYHNDYIKKNYSLADSDILAKFYYSYDNNDWTVINNVLRTQQGELKPMMGNNYDISSVVDNIKVSSDSILNVKKSEVTNMYWKVEITFRNNDDIVNNNFIADFYIEYLEK